jgi:hypothetical protein
MPESFALVLDPTTADPGRVVAGLPLALRLALDAQQAGASAIVVAPGETRTRAALGDPRLRIPVLERVPEGARVVRVPSNYVVHRGLFKFIFEQDSADPTSPRERDLGNGPVPCDAP